MQNPIALHPAPVRNNLPDAFDPHFASGANKNSYAESEKQCRDKKQEGFV